jgi:hypothetical protein
VLKYVKDMSIPEEKIKVIVNEKNLGAMYSIYHAVTYECKEKEIVVLVDGDDSLVGK